MARRLAVTLYYDVTSPYSWLAFEVLCRYRVLWQMDLKLKPAFLGAVMQNTGNQPPGLLPQRGHYMMKDVKRLATFMDVPLKTSDECWKYIMTKGTLAPQRLLTAANQECPEHLEALSRQLWTRLWSQSKEIHEKETFIQICAEVGMSRTQAEQLCAAATTTEVKEKLKAVTQEVIDLGAFGLPVFTTQLPQFEKPQMFFGSDRLELLAHAVGKPWLGPCPEQRSKL